MCAEDFFLLGKHEMHALPDAFGSFPVLEIEIHFQIENTTMVDPCQRFFQHGTGSFSRMKLE
jgi:hypothetical protein